MGVSRHNCHPCLPNFPRVEACDANRGDEKSSSCDIQRGSENGCDYHAAAFDFLYLCSHVHAAFQRSERGDRGFPLF